MNSVLGQVIVPLALSILTAYILENIDKLGLGPVASFLLATATIIVILLPVLYLRFIGAVFQSAGVWHIGGTWRGEWRYVKEGETVIVADRLKVRQWGSFVFGVASSSTSSKRAPFSSFRYRFQGVLNGEGLVEGRWQNIDKGRVYYGVFQLKIARTCNNVSGYWIGSARDELNCGSWMWSREGIGGRSDSPFAVWGLKKRGVKQG